MRVDLAQLGFVDVNLRKMAAELEKDTGVEFTVTSLYRPGDTGVHGQIPLRGVDLRMRNRTIGEAVEASLNKTWQYDPERPHMQCAILHGEGSNLHLHLQTHPRTKRRG